MHDFDARELRHLAQRALRLDRKARRPTGGISTGDDLLVGMRDFFRLTRLARRVIDLTAEQDDVKEKT